MERAVKVEDRQDNSELCLAVPTFQLYLANKIELPSR